jgi:hypothetical protein
VWIQRKRLAAVCTKTRRPTYDVDREKTRMETNASRQRTGGSAHANDMRAAQRRGKLQDDRDRVQYFDPKSRPDPQLRRDREAKAGGDHFTNSHSPPGHEHCVDRLCLVCLNAERERANLWFVTPAPPPQPPPAMICVGGVLEMNCERKQPQRAEGSGGLRHKHG